MLTNALRAFVSGPFKKNYKKKKIINILTTFSIFLEKKYIKFFKIIYL